MRRWTELENDEVFILSNHGAKEKFQWHLVLCSFHDERDKKFGEGFDWESKSGL